MITLYVFDTQKCIAHKTNFPCSQTTLFVMYVSDSLKKNHFESFVQQSDYTGSAYVFDGLKCTDSCVRESDYTDFIVCV